MRAHSTFMAAICSTLVMGLTGTVLAAQAGDASVKAQMQRLQDREAIETLLVTYGRLLDRGDLVAYSRLFAADGVWEGGIGSATGPKGIQQMLERVYARVKPGQYANAFHIMSGFIIEVTGDTATSWSRWTWFVEGADGKPLAQRSGHYEDQLVREGGQWRFKHRLTVTELPPAEKDAEAQIFRKDHREAN
jgi:SnoaL-like domain